MPEAFQQRAAPGSAVRPASGDGEDMADPIECRLSLLAVVVVPRSPIASMDAIGRERLPVTTATHRPLPSKKTA